jgi:glutaredoxin
VSRRTGGALLALVFVCAAAQAGGVYKWIGPDGQVQFGDRPPPDAQIEEVRIPSFAGTAEVEAGAPASQGVVMLSTVWCGVCKRAREYMTRQQIAFTEYDVEKNDTGRALYRELKGRGVPIILVGNQRMNGFSAAQLEQMLKRSGR